MPLSSVTMSGRELKRNGKVRVVWEITSLCKEQQSLRIRSAEKSQWPAQRIRNTKQSPILPKHLHLAITICHQYIPHFAHPVHLEVSNQLTRSLLLNRAMIKQRSQIIASTLSGGAQQASAHTQAPTDALRRSTESLGARFPTVGAPALLRPHGQLPTMSHSFAL